MHDNKFTYDDFIKYKFVSRETFNRLQLYVELLEKWQKTINLISNSTLKNIWHRHIIDSIQLVGYISTDDSVIDIGSGAGLPGLVLAIAGIKNITLVESDARKVAFLREAARVTRTEIVILNQRVEEGASSQKSIITARGFAPLSQLLVTLPKTLTNSNKLLLLKGKNYLEEIRIAQNDWKFDFRMQESITDKESVVLEINNITPIKTPHTGG